MNAALRMPTIIPAAVFIAATVCAAAPTPAQITDAPLPEVSTLLHNVEANQEKLDRAREEYTFRQHQRITMYDKKGQVRRVEDRVSNVFFVHGHAIETLVSKDGKPLSAGDLKKEEERATKQAVKYASQPYGEP
ncbi:MAG TPA: hypothetical protein VF126_12445, partial [Acidobacteriaceae bacterium]